MTKMCLARYRERRYRRSMVKLHQEAWLEASRQTRRWLAHLFGILAVISVSSAGLEVGSSTELRPDAQVTIVELFTSQGCSSCPPANAFTRRLAEKDDVLVLTYSVDYWDYLGWKDTLGGPEFSVLQREYSQYFEGQVYTPQIIVNGAVENYRFTEQQVRRHELDGSLVPIDIRSDTDGIQVHIKTPALPVAEARVLAVWYQPGIQAIDVRRGENRGRNMKVANAVTDYERLGTATAEDEFSHRLRPLENGEALAILVHSGKSGRIVSATRYGVAEPGTILAD